MSWRGETLRREGGEEREAGRKQGQWNFGSGGLPLPVTHTRRGTLPGTRVAGGLPGMWRPATARPGHTRTREQYYGGVTWAPSHMEPANAQSTQARAEESARAAVEREEQREDQCDRFFTELSRGENQ
eukprot:3766161-Rhodomonas_salina.1